MQNSVSGNLLQFCFNFSPSEICCSSCSSSTEVPVYLNPDSVWHWSGQQTNALCGCCKAVLAWGNLGLNMIDDIVWSACLWGCSSMVGGSRTLDMCHMSGRWGMVDGTYFLSCFDTVLCLVLCIFGGAEEIFSCGLISVVKTGSVLASWCSVCWHHW